MKAIAAAIAGAALLTLPGCGILQGSYDSQARNECQDIPDVQERLDCERAVSEGERQRRQDGLAND